MTTLVMAFPLMVAAPAHAGEPWVNRAEYRAVHAGHTMAHVHRVFDTKGQGELAGGMHAGHTRSYRMKVDGKRRCVSVTYVRKNGAWRLTSKSRPFRPYSYGSWACDL